MELFAGAAGGQEPENDARFISFVSSAVFFGAPWIEPDSQLQLQGVQRSARLSLGPVSVSWFYLVRVGCFQAFTHFCYQVSSGLV